MRTGVKEAGRGNGARTWEERRRSGEEDRHRGTGAEIQEGRTVERVEARIGTAREGPQQQMMKDYGDTATRWTPSQRPSA